MNAKHGLADKTVAQITGVLARFPEVQKAVLFGSRAKGTHTRGSDIDLALLGKNVDWQTIGQINNALDDLPIPYQFSLIAFSKRTDPDVAVHIHRVGIPFYEREMALAEPAK